MRLIFAFMMLYGVVIFYTLKGATYFYGVYVCIYFLPSRGDTLIIVDDIVVMYQVVQSIHSSCR